MAKLGNIALIAVVGVAGLGLAAHSFAQGSGSEKMGHGFGPRGEGPPAFETLDTNADGVVTVDEIRALEAAKFAEADTNGDGVLDQDELLEHAVAQMRERAGEMLSRMIAWQDKDGDGALSADEMPGDRMGAMLSRVDADGDGQITAEEYETAISKHRDRGERGRHGHGHGDRDDG